MGDVCVFKTTTIFYPWKETYLTQCAGNCHSGGEVTQTAVQVPSTLFEKQIRRSISTYSGQLQKYPIPRKKYIMDLGTDCTPNCAAEIQFDAFCWYKDDCIQPQLGPTNL